MVDALKKMDKKFLIIIGCIILIPILLLIFLAIIQGCGNRKITYEKYESKMITATEKYIKDKDMQPQDESETVTVTLSQLVEGEYIKTTEKLLDDSTCDGSVTVRRNGSSIETNEGGYLNYTVDLKCDNHSTVHLVDKLLENVVTSESGLYKIEDGYVFKGDKVKNYITFFGQDYRIMSVDENGILKLVKAESEINSRIWDNKYNTEIGYSYGKNIYKDSDILTQLLSDYNNVKKISTDAKKHVVAYDSCIGKRSSTDYSINKKIDCSDVLEKQVISLINVSDYAMASTDPDCNSIKSRACKNYNYLSDISLSGWTLNSLTDNTYEIFYLSDGLIEITNANSYVEYSIVIYIDGNELYTSGNGTSTDPYIIK